MELLEYNRKKIFINLTDDGDNFIFRLYVGLNKKESVNLDKELLKIEIMEAIKFGDIIDDFEAEEIISKKIFSFDADFLANIQRKLLDSYFNKKDLQNG